MKPAIVLSTLMMLFGRCRADLQSRLGAIDVPDRVSQLVVVLSENWDSSVGVMRLFEREEGDWREVGPRMDVVLGGNGMGWGIGVPWKQRSGPIKVEGDGRSPAGAFELTATFGYAPRPPDGTALPYRPVTEYDYFVDDPVSEDYNKWVRIGEDDKPTDRWYSFEIMLRPDSLYEYGIIVGHNMAPVVKRRGSAIFIHIWRSPGVPTSGCTALARSDLLHLISWLDIAHNPLLLQLPGTEIDGFRFLP